MSNARIRVLVVLVLCASSWSAPAADFWVSAQRSTDKAPLFAAVDVETIVEADGFRTVWTYVFEGSNGRLISVKGLRVSFRCNADEFAPRQIVEYRPDSLSVLSSVTAPTIEFESPVPGTNVAGIFRFVCEDSRDAFWPLQGDNTLNAVKRAALSYFRSTSN